MHVFVDVLYEIQIYCCQYSFKNNERNVYALYFDLPRHGDVNKI